MSALHITNGDCAARTLREFLSGRVITTCDVLHDGPAPDVDGAPWHELRARFLSGPRSRDRQTSVGEATPTFANDADYQQIVRGLAATDRLIADDSRYDELVLWFEHDLFDQLLLIRTLDLIRRLTTRAAGSATTHLICIDRFPGVERFIGLGQLDARQLATLVETRRPVTREQFDLASRAWSAFRAPDPTALAALARRTSDADATSRALPFLADALRRLLAEYPSTTRGLSRSAELALESLDAGPLDGHVLFAETQAREERPFIGDWSFFDIVWDLATARVPLVVVRPHDGAIDLRDHDVRLTDAGRDVLAGRRDALVLNGIDEWRGGVHLTGSNSSPWRWDAARETLVS